MIGAIFVDGGSISFSLKDQDKPAVPFRIDYSSLVNLLRTDLTSEVIEFRYKCYYTSFRPGTKDPLRDRAHSGFKRHMVETGWTFFEVAAKSYPDGHWEDKGLDLALALDCFELCKSDLVQVVVVATHDSDFKELFHRISPTKLKFVLGWRHKMAVELPKVASPIYLDDIKERVRY